jgi:hypothetical protein
VGGGGNTPPLLQLGDTDARLRISLPRLRPVHRHAADGRVRPTIGVPRVHEGRAARAFYRAALLDALERAAHRPRDERAKRTCSQNAVASQGRARRRMLVLLGAVAPSGGARQEWHQGLSNKSPLDDLALSVHFARRATSPRAAARSVKPAGHWSPACRSKLSASSRRPSSKANSPR